MSTIVLIGLLLASTVALTRWVPRHPRWRPFVIALNLAVTIRYLWWRGTETLNWDGGWGMAVSLTTYVAELYGFLVVLHHYAIATRSLDRTSTRPGADFAPSVDIFVPSYNESPDILTRTLVGCQAIDYGNKRVYLLDDGRRRRERSAAGRRGVVARLQPPRRLVGCLSGHSRQCQRANLGRRPGDVSGRGVCLRSHGGAGDGGVRVLSQRLSRIATPPTSIRHTETQRQ